MFRSASIAALFASAAAAKPIFSTQINDGIVASSETGSRLLSKARALGNNNNNQDANLDISWMPNYSFRYAGCSVLPQFAEDGGAMTNKMLIKFKMCPSGSCSASCSGGDYVVLGSTFIDAYTEAKMNAQEYACESTRETCEYYCQTQANNAYYDGDTCKSGCFTDAGMGDCEDAQNGDDDKEEFNIQEYLECKQMEGGNNNNNNNNNGEAVQYYIGPACTDGKVYLGVFTDQYCSTAASNGISLYYSSYGSALPYSTEPIVGTDCISCKDNGNEDNNNNNNNNNNDQAAEVNILEGCGNIYYTAGKCEKNLASVSTTPDTGACDFILNTLSSKSGGVSYLPSGGGAAKAFASIFFISTVGLAAYVYFLLNKAKRAGVKLHDADGEVA